jgi:hypothetical protein
VKGVNEFPGYNESHEDSVLLADGDGQRRVPVVEIVHVHDAVIGEIQVRVELVDLGIGVPDVSSRKKPAALSIWLLDQFPFQ